MSASISIRLSSVWLWFCLPRGNLLRVGRDLLDAFQCRISDRTDVRINAFQIAQNIKMQGRGFERFWTAFSQTL
jgi:hypothetical protein